MDGPPQATPSLAWPGGARAGDALKRALDVLLAAALLVLLSPALLLLALAVPLESRGPVLYRCPRIGRDGRPFGMLKFRKMRRGAGGPPLTAAADPRLTRLGRLLVRTRLDELPQLVNVLRGEMSLVGPRPEDPLFVAERPDAFARVLSVRPGITGLAQLAYKRESAILDPSDPLADYRGRVLPAKLALDRLYVARRSLALDLAVLAWTALAVATGWEVAVDRTSARLRRRRRPAGLARA